MKKHITMRQYKPEDKPQVLELLNRNFEKQQHLNIVRDNEWWEWKYEKSIFGKPIIYVAEFNESIIAVRPLWPWKLNIRGNEYNCFQPLDSVVDKEYRGEGLFSKLTKEAILENNSYIDMIFNFPNEQSIGAYLNLGWSFVGKLQWYVKVYKPINVYGLLRHYSDFKSCRLDQNDLITYEKINSIKEFSNLNSKFKTIRNKGFLTWRYLEHPKFNYGMSIIENARKQLVFIYEINQNNYGKELIVIDYFGDLSLFEPMLRELNSISKKYQVSYILLLKKYDTPKNVLLNNFYIKQNKKNFVVLPLKIELDRLAIEYESWDLFLGMHDSI